MSIVQALANASQLSADFVGESGYALAYGSHASLGCVPDSDLDLLFVGGPPLTPGRIDRLVRRVKSLHHDHGLRLDTEVAYEVKLYATLADVELALMLRGFTVDQSGELLVRPVVAQPQFLNSTPFKLRLILNALTTPHVFLGGDIGQDRQHCASADRSVALLALSLSGLADAFSVEDAAGVLVSSSEGAAGKDFLGYTHGPGLYSTLQRGFAQLAREQVVHVIDGVRYEEYPGRRRRLLAATSPPSSDGTDGAETMAYRGRRTHG